MEKQNQEYPQIIKILPYRGENNEVSEGRKTKITLFDDRLEYSVKYTESVKITIGDSDDSEVIHSFNYNEEDGTIDKDSILGIVKYIKTSYNDEMEPYNVNYIDICSQGNQLTFSTENKEDKNYLYNEIYNWKYGEQNKLYPKD